MKPLYIDAPPRSAAPLALTEGRQNVCKALAAADRAARQLAPVFTVITALNDDDCAGDTDAVLAATDRLAQQFFGSVDLDVEQALGDLTGRHNPMEEPVQELYSRILDEVSAQRRAAFALGVAFGQLQSKGGAR